MATKHSKDMEKDVQALMELQDKLNAHAGLKQMVGFLTEGFQRASASKLATGAHSR